MKDLQLDQYGDLFFDSVGNMNIVDGIDEVKQRLHTRLLRFLGEWYLDITLGVPYLQEILIKNPSQAAVVNNIKQTILKTKGVTGITDFVIKLNTDGSGNIVQRSVVIEFSATTDQGDVDMSISATIN